jgi:hypothetical protein
MLRRQGQHHHVSPQHLYPYANHAAWLEDHRRECNAALVRLVLGLKDPVSRAGKGWWSDATRRE